MNRSSLSGLAALMVATALFLFSCTHGTSPASPPQARPATSGVQSPAPPKMVVEDDAAVSAARSEISFPLPAGWVRVPQEHLKQGHDFALLSESSSCIIFGYVSSEIPGPPGVYLALRGVSGMEQGFTLKEPFLSKDGTWGLLAMGKGDDFIVFGMKMVSTEPAQAIFVFARSPTSSSAELEAAMSSLLEAISLTPASAK